MLYGPSNPGSSSARHPEPFWRSDEAAHPGIYSWGEAALWARFKTLGHSGLYCFVYIP